MGLFDRLRGIKDPVEAEYRLVACSSASGGAVYENCTMDGVVSAPGITPTSVRHTSLTTPVSKWPQPGTVLPVTVDRQDPRRLKVRWDAVPTNAQLAQQLSRQQAEAMRAHPAGAGPAADAAQALPPEAAALMTDLAARARAAGATVTTSVEQSVVGAAGRQLPGAAGGGLTPDETARALREGPEALGLRRMTGRVLAAHEIPTPGMATAPGGTWDLTLDVDPGDGAGWTSVLRIGFSSRERQALIGAVGRVLPLIADPVRHDRVAVDVGRLG